MKTTHLHASYGELDLTWTLGSTTVEIALVADDRCTVIRVDAEALSEHLRDVAFGRVRGRIGTAALRACTNDRPVDARYAVTALNEADEHILFWAGASTDVDPDHERLGGVTVLLSPKQRHTVLDTLDLVVEAERSRTAILAALTNPKAAA